MGKSLERNESFAQGNFPGCMAGILHVLDYHHWHVKKLIPHKKHAPRSRSRGVSRNQNPKVILKTHDEVFMDADSELEPFLAKPHDTNSAPVTKRRGKTRSKFPSQENHRSWILWFSLQTWLQRINPLHHLVPLENFSDDIDSRDNKSPWKRKAVRNVTNKSNEASKEASNHQLEGCADVLEIFKVNKDFFFKILQDNDDITNRTHGLKNSNIKVKLSKSMSFPVANSPQAKLVRPSTLKHKQSEVWFFLNGDKSSVHSQELSTESKAKESSHGHGWNQVVTSRFRDIKHKIKHALLESKRENVNLIEAAEISEGMEKTNDRESNEVDCLNDDDLETRRLQRVRRTSSLNESIHRYTHLFDNTSSRDTDKYTHSRSLTLLTSEMKVPSQSRKESRRNLSLPDIDSLSPFLNVSSIDALRLARAYSRASVDYSADLTVDENDTPEPARESSVCQEEEVFLEAETEMPILQDTELESKFVQTDEPDCYDFIQDVKIDHIHENEDFNYVRQILESSNSIGVNEASTWHSLDQPLSPSIFKQLENQSHQELVSFEDEINHNYSQLLFDLVNEILGDMNEKSYSYFPRRHSRPLPTGKRLLEDVWTATSWYLSLIPEADKSLDDVVGRDLAKMGSKWMSLEWEREMVALELEDLFFDELLEEVLCCLE